MIFAGSKYYKFNENDELELIRIKRIKPDGNVKVYSEDNVDNIITLTEDEIRSNYTLLNPSGYITFSIVNLQQGKDVIVALHNRKSIMNNDSKPYCVCRQNITDLFANQIKINNSEYHGVSISQETCPVDLDFTIMLACDGIDKQYTIAIYLDDKLEDILRFVKLKSYDSVLESSFCDHAKYSSTKSQFNSKGMSDMLYKQIISKDIHLGYCKTLKLLLETNNFMYDFYRCFGIIPINISMDNSEEAGLSDLVKSVLSRLLCVNIDKSIVLKYDRDIDLSKIKENYLLVSDSNQNVYVVAYITKGEYHIPIEDVESPDNIANMYNNIIQKESFTHSSIKEAYYNLSMNVDKYKS